MTDCPCSEKKQIRKGPGLLMDCGVWCQDSGPTTDVDIYYKSEYRVGHPIKETDNVRALWIAQQLPGGPGTMLDVGCGDGRAMRFAANRGWEVEGVEPDELTRKEASGFGMVYKSLDEVTGHYDCLVASHVIEHIPDAPGFLRRLRNYADDFIFIVPIESYGFPHLWGFTETGFDQFVKCAGYKIVRKGFLPKIHYWTICKKDDKCAK